MDMNEYQKAAMRTARTGTLDTRQLLTNAALGLAGESGEFADIIKKYLFQGHGFDFASVVDEIGDILWYVSLASAAVGLPLGDIAQRNIAKLRERYPAGFDQERSMHRENGAP